MNDGRLMKLKDVQIKKLLLEYNAILKQLRDAGVIRNNKLVGEYGEYFVAKKLDLKLAKSGTKGYDAIDSAGKKYEIKTRKEMPYSKPNNFQVQKTQLQSADFLIYVEFDNDWNLSKLLKIPTSKVIYNEYDRVIINKKLEKFSIL